MSKVHRKTMAVKVLGFILPLGQKVCVGSAALHRLRQRDAAGSPCR